MLDLTKIKGEFTVSVDTYEEFIQLRDYTIANCKKCRLEKSEPWMDGRIYSNTINECKDNFCMNYNNNTEGLIYYGYCYEAYYIREGYKIYAFSDLISEQDQIKSKPDLSFKKTITMKEVYSNELRPN